MKNISPLHKRWIPEGWIRGIRVTFRDLPSIRIRQLGSPCTVGKALKTGEDAKLPKEKVAKAAGEAESVVVVSFDTWERVMEAVGLRDELDGVIGSMGRTVSLPTNLP